MKLFQLLPKKLYDFACNLPPRRREGTQEPGHKGRLAPPGEQRTENGEQNAPAGRPAKPPSIHSIFGTSQTCRGCRENFSLPGCGAAPHTFQSANQLPLVSFVPSLCTLW